MSAAKRPINSHKAYHAHIYFNEQSKRVAKRLCQETEANFSFRVGRFHEKLIGPHPCWSCQITFGTRDFEDFIPWLDARRQGLTVLIHALTGNDLKDHTEFAYWLGQPVKLNLDIFKTA